MDIKVDFAFENGEFVKLKGDMLKRTLGVVFARLVRLQGEFQENLYEVSWATTNGCNRQTLAQSELESAL